jgi:hypothetical protein
MTPLGGMHRQHMLRSDGTVASAHIMRVMTRRCFLARFAPALLIVFASALVLATRSAAQDFGIEREVDGIVAIVGGHTPGPLTQVVLRSDVELRARLAVATRSPDLHAFELPPALLAATLQELIGELLVAREAERLHAPEPTEAQVAQHREELVRTLGGPERFARFIAVYDVLDDEIQAIARRRAFVDMFLRANLEGSTLVSDAQLTEVYESGEHPFADRPLDEVRDALRAWLGAAALSRDVARWIDVLRSRTPVRVIVPFAPPRAEDSEDGGSRR